MRIILQKAFSRFQTLHPDSRTALDRWVRIAGNAEWTSFDDVRATLGRKVDRYKQFFIFDIGGTKYRLIAVVNFKTDLVTVRHVLTHAEYDRGKWKGS